MSVSKPVALIVDDSPSNIQLMASILQDLVQLSAATSGDAALQLLASGLTPDLVLLDLWMPDMDGFDVAAILAADDRWKAIPVICVTARTDAVTESRAIGAGMVDFLHKPLSPDVVRARISLHLGRKAADKAVAQARERELLSARLIQRDLLLSPIPDRVGSFELSSHCEASQTVDGDFQTFTRLGPDTFELLVGDVMGKGLNAALTGAAVTTQYRNALTSLLLDGQGATPSTADIANEMHRRLFAQLSELETFVTLMLVRFDGPRREVEWVNAGHTSGLLTGSLGARDLSGPNLPFGILQDERYVSDLRPLQPGDTVLLWSDGISEATCARGDEFGEDRIHRIVEDHRACGPAAVLDRLVAAIDTHTDCRQPQDDRSAICLRYAAKA